MKKRKICVVTGARAEYGLLYWIMKSINDDPKLELQIIATGMHLSPEFGLTYREIEDDGFTIDYKIEMILSSDSEVGISKSMGLGVIGIADALAGLKPDLLVVLGDRFEIFSAVSVAMVAKIPMMPTITISSVRVKPRSVLRMVWLITAPRANVES